MPAGERKPRRRSLDVDGRVVQHSSAFERRSRLAVGARGGLSIPGWARFPVAAAFRESLASDRPVSRGRRSSGSQLNAARPSSASSVACLVPIGRFVLRRCFALHGRFVLRGRRVSRDRRPPGSRTQRGRSPSRLDRALDPAHPGSRMLPPYPEERARTVAGGADAIRATSIRSESMKRRLTLPLVNLTKDRSAPPEVVR
jgi:hypothetical protein